MPKQSRHPLCAFGWSERVQALFSPLADRGLRPARVIAVERRGCRLATPEGPAALPLFDLGVGDWVALDGAALSSVLTRWSCLERLDPGGANQVLACNIDIVLVTAPGDRLSLSRIEREVAIVWESGARPVVVLTKCDLAPVHSVAAITSRLGALEVIATSAVDGTGLDALRALLVEPITAALLGPSGAGKSSLVNALLGKQHLAVGDVRSKDGRGRHTTTSRKLIPLPSGGSLVDMPGLRTLGTDAGADALAATFDDITSLSLACRFRDCMHESEPGCAVLAARDSGQLDQSRLASYHKLLAETAFERRRIDPIARSEASRIWRARSKEQRRNRRDHSGR